MASSASKMAKTIQSLAYRHGTYNVFADFCELAACSFSNAVDRHHYEKREARYMTIIKKYAREEVDVFPTLLGMLTMEMELHPRDVLGEVFSELELHNEHAGQFFTPYHLCEMIARMTFDEGAKQTISEKGHITLQEPACGAGAMVIAFATNMLIHELNYQECLHVSAIDIDSRCVHMAYIQFSLLHIPAVVYAGNTLTMEMRDAWYTPAHIMGGWNWRLNRPSHVEASPDAAVTDEDLIKVVTPPVELISVPDIPKSPAKKSSTQNQPTLF